MTEQKHLTLPEEQFRLVRLQTANWGLFKDIVDIPISPKGFLFVGGSGSGKSTLIDAFAQLLIPQRWLRYNAAADESGSRAKGERSLVTYLRGVYGKLDSEDLSLRPAKGDTANTASGIAATFRNGLGATVTIFQCFLLNASNDLKRVFGLSQKDLELEETIGRWCTANGDFKAFRAAMPEAKLWDQFSAYSAEFRRQLLIPKEQVLKLLHKAQSAKNPGDINEFLRTFVLDEPQAFGAAEDLVEDFQALSNAHELVIRARRQIETLSPAEEAVAVKHEADARAADLELLKRDAEPYGRGVQLSLFDESIAETKTALAECERKERALENDCRHLTETVTSLRVEIERNGGGRLESLQRDKTEKERERDRVTENARRFAELCARAGAPVPKKAEEFDRLQKSAAEETAAYPGRRDELAQKRSEAAIAHHGAREERRRTEEAVRLLCEQRSGIPPEYVRRRRTLAEAAGVDEKDLPFAGEFIEMKSDDTRWRGAVERWLNPFALTILVRPDIFERVAETAGRTDLGGMLRFVKAGGAVVACDSPLPDNSVLAKIRVLDCPLKDRIEAMLRQAWAAECLPSDFLLSAKQVVTAEGMVRRGPVFEKDDRFAPADPKGWVLGADIEAKLAVLQKEAKKHLDEERRLTKELAALKTASDELDSRHNILLRLPEFTWESIDPSPLLAAVKMLEALIEREREASDKLRRLEADLRAAEKTLAEKTGALSRQTKETGAVEAKLKETEAGRESVAAKLKDAEPVSAYAREELPSRFAAAGEKPTLADVETIIATVKEALGQDIGRERRRSYAAQTKAEKCFAAFRSRWEAECTGLADGFEYADEYLEKLRVLRIDDLPAHEGNFRDLLHSQGLQKAAALLHTLKSEILESSERMAEVNDSLSRVPFDVTGKNRTYIVLCSDKKPLPEHRTLCEDITALLNEASKPDPDDAVYETRFALLKKIAEELQDESFRFRALDTRRQINFYAEEKDGNGNRIFTYDSGSGKSGGERLKLTSACLAAALRYQLCGETDAEPGFAPVVFDEAFDKADETKARLSLEMFRNFGFQPILVTPGKLVTTIEPFVGGAFCVAKNGDYVSSGVSLMYDDAQSKFVRDARFSSAKEVRQ